MTAIVLLAVACGGSSVQPSPIMQKGEGTLELPLVSTSAAGRTYKLVGATFVITGEQSVTITDTSADTVSVPLIAGDYSIQMNGSWHIERTDAPGQTVQATLVSPNPMRFTLAEGEMRPVRFLFKVPGEILTDVGFSVDDGGWISGSFKFGPRPPPPPYFPPDYLGFFNELWEKTVPFVISFESTTATRAEEDFRKLLIIQTSPITLQFGGEHSDVLQHQVIPAFQGLPMQFILEADTSQPISYVYMRPVELTSVSGELALQMDLYLPGLLGMDMDGYPRFPNATSFDGSVGMVLPGNPTFYGNSIYGSIIEGSFAPR
ncbi:hypothetical protein HJC22_00290 [Corallococcus exiguus]|nr:MULTISPECIES: hypothetical protein [Corallococcus]NNC14168.1 hypothetical protein [Corallococcus exiguus]NRD52034.1 hypothetical protein [Corallococcus exiguus]RUO94599.1 hypothetical protein D7Y11_03675 [Corallococcus sp. AB018]